MDIIVQREIISPKWNCLNTHVENWKSLAISMQQG